MHLNLGKPVFAARFRRRPRHAVYLGRYQIASATRTFDRHRHVLRFIGSYNGNMLLHRTLIHPQPDVHLFEQLLLEFFFDSTVASRLGHLLLRLLFLDFGLFFTQPFKWSQDFAFYAFLVHFSDC